MKLLFIYLLIINALGFVLMLLDKQKAKMNQWRIPEATLICVAVLGGSLGSLLGMRSARHKTKHLKFSLGIPFILAVQILLTLLVYHLTTG